MSMMQNITEKGVSLVFRASEGRGPQNYNNRKRLHDLANVDTSFLTSWRISNKFNASATIFMKISSVDDWCMLLKGY